MKKSDVYRLMDLIEDVKKIDSMIILHNSSNDTQLMIDQYEAKKTKLIGQLIDELVAPSLRSPQSFSLIQQIIDKYYPAKDRNSTSLDDEISMLAAAI